MNSIVRSMLPFLFAGLFAAHARALDAGVSHVVYSTLSKNYLEVSLEIAAASVTFAPVDTANRQAKVEVMILVTQNETVVNFEKYVMLSPLVPFPQSLLDVKRMVLPNGQYNLEVTCTDLNAPENKDVYKSSLNVDIAAGLYLSELALMRDLRPDNGTGPFNKNGLYLEPLPFNFYDKSAVTLAFYAEVYHSDAATGAADYQVRYFVEKDKGNGNRELVSSGNQRKKPAPIDAVLVQMDIRKVESGNYWLTVELRSATNELLATRTLAFQRSNPYLNVADSEITDEMLERQFVQQLDDKALRYSLRAISPLTNNADAEMIKNMLKGSDLKAMRFFVFTHFARQNPNAPDQAFNEYMELAAKVDKRFFSGFRYGFETDRGRIFMRYGKPDDLIHVEDDPSAPPYEIWVYYNFPKTKQNNVKFLFYNPTLAGEDYVLLHSNARGEVNNPRWEIELYKRNAGEQYDGDNFQDATRMQRNVNRNARVYFEDF